MVAEVGIGTNTRPGRPLFTFCYPRRHATVAKMGDPAGFTSPGWAGFGPEEPLSSWHCGML